MTKLLMMIINSCDECPLHAISMSGNAIGKLVCNHGLAKAPTPEAIIEDIKDIPEWCPLRDY